jgi:hypothetical protein
MHNLNNGGRQAGKINAFGNPFLGIEGCKLQVKS